MIDQLAALLGKDFVLVGDDRDKWRMDWTGVYAADPIAVLRPRDTAEVAGIMKIADAHDTPVVPVGGNTGLTGGTSGKDMLMISLDRLNDISELDPTGRTATVGAGVILSTLHTAADAHDLIFPLTFGARGSAMIGGVLSTNAGGSNVVRYGNTRDLCLGLEVVTAQGEVMNLMGKLHKDNAGLNLKHLFIGAEGTLGIITRAVVKLHPKPRAYATAMVALQNLSDAVNLLNRLQAASGNAVEAFEYMPRPYIAAHCENFAQASEPFAEKYAENVFLELGATNPHDARRTDDGSVPIQSMLTEILADMLEKGELLDAVIAQNDAQRKDMWKRREDAGEFLFLRKPHVNTDVAVALTDVAPYLAEVTRKLAKLDPGAEEVVVSHLGDGNIHHTAYPTSDDPALHRAIRDLVDQTAVAYRGSFSAEHGVGVSKLGTMAQCKDSAALGAMRAIKSALDPKGLLNPGKVYPAG